MLFLTLIGHVVQLLEEAQLDTVSILVAIAFHKVQGNITPYLDPALKSALLPQLL